MARHDLLACYIPAGYTLNAWRLLRSSPPETRSMRIWCFRFGHAASNSDSAPPLATHIRKRRSYSSAHACLASNSRCRASSS